MEQRFCLKDAHEIFMIRKFHPLSLHNKALTESKKSGESFWFLEGAGAGKAIDFLKCIHSLLARGYLNMGCCPRKTADY